MNEVKKTTIGGRIRAAWRALTGKPKDTLEMGLSIKPCSKCERGDCTTCGYKVHSERVSELPNCNDCGKALSCEYKPRWGAPARINCPLWEKEAAK